MPRRRFPLLALSFAAPFAALPFAAAAQDADASDVSGQRIIACEADRTAEGCSTLLSQIFVCDGAPEMAGCDDLLGLREAAVDLAEREAALNGDDDGEGVIFEPEESENDVLVRAEGELVEELEDEALTEVEEQLRAEDDLGTDDATGRPDDDDEDASGSEDDDAAADAESGDEAASGSEGGEEAPAGSEGDEAAAADEQADNATSEAAQDNACPVLASSDWAAWVNAMPGPDGAQVIVTGTVTLPSPGYNVALEQGISDRSARPVQTVQLSAEPPASDASEEPTEYEARFEMPSAGPIEGTTAPFTAVRVVCGDEELARIEPVEVAQ